MPYGYRMMVQKLQNHETAIVTKTTSHFRLGNPPLPDSVGQTVEFT